MTAKQVERLFAILAEHIVPKAELDWETPLDLLVAVVLSAQSTDKAVNRITASLRQECRTPEEYLELGEEGLQERIRTIGLFRNKAKSIIGLCERLAAEHEGSVPRTREALQALPGVGRKTANVVLNVAFGQPVIAVDTHIFRVANRVGLTCEKTPEKTELALLKRVPERYLKNAHHYLLLHGRYTCTARKPACGTCPARPVCLWPGKTTEADRGTP
jgi:endonuclease-3